MKKHLLFLYTGISLVYLLSSCQWQSKNTDMKLPIAIEWEVLSNTDQDEPSALMRFQVTNNSTIELNSKNWAMYFNQPPRSVLPGTDTATAKVSRIKGDWYELRLQANAVIGPGEHFEMTYRVSHWIIKETDAPQGLYSTLYNANGEVLNHYPIDSYLIKPFTRAEQINRHKNDNIAIPTAEWQYLYNKKHIVSEVSDILPIIPQPKSIKTYEEYLELSNTFVIIANEELNNEASYLSHYLQKLTGNEFKITTFDGSQNKTINLTLDSKFENTEAYTLEINNNKINITAGTNAGVFYGIQSLLNAIDLKYYKNHSKEISIRQMTVIDESRFAYRGLHLDVCRNFQSKEEIIRILDLMAFYKLNKLHFYITEDEGWRIEIEEIPELTTYGARRGHTFSEAKHLMPAYGSGPFTQNENAYGSGYYSREDYKEIIRHAKSRHIDVIPSINFPGHARAAVQSMEARYRNYMADGDSINANKYRLIDPNDQSKYSSVQGYTDNVVDVGLESTYTFFETVIDDIIEVYQEAGVELTTIHTGGDEVPYGVWTDSPASTKLLESLPSIHDPKNLQAYYFKRISDILYERGITTGGWEEVALTRTPDGEHAVNPEFVDKKVTPYVWNNFGNAIDLTHKLANAGYPVVFCGVTNLYFDMAYNKDPKEPGYYWGGFVNERKVWELSPFNLIETTTTDNMGHAVNLENKVKLTENGKNNILGLQAELWSETVKGPEMLEYYLLPKLISFAERAWAKEEAWEALKMNTEREHLMTQSWLPFINTLANKDLPRLNYMNNGYNYRIPKPGVLVEEQKISINHEYPGTNIYYTNDDTEPTSSSLLYTSPIQQNGIIKIKAIDSEGKESRMVVISEK